MDRNVNSSIGERVHSYLKEKGIKCTYISNELGIHKQALNAVFNGERKLSAVEYLKICSLLGVSADFFSPYADGIGK